MLKVFLVEDESIMREGLRDNIPWQQYGYEFVGEASDGEMALPLIRKAQPDVLITDIKMPFMDGLALSELVIKELPSTKIVIISGHDEFELARKAIQIGVEQYLLKPITRSALQKVLLDIREKIESEQDKKNYLEEFLLESHEYEQFARRNFFEKVFSGTMPVQDIYSEAQKLDIEIDASSYNLILFNIQDADEARQGEGSGEYILENIQRAFMRYTEFIMFRWNVNSYGILIMGDEEHIDELTNKGIGVIKRAVENLGENIDWSVAASDPVNRLSFLSECYKEVNRIFSYRFLIPGTHILNKDMVKGLSGNESNESYDKLDVNQVDPEILKGFLNKGTLDEVADFAEGYIESLTEPLKSKLFRDYMVLNIRFAVLSYVQSIGGDQEEFLAGIELHRENEMAQNLSELKEYMTTLLNAAIRLRDEKDSSQSKHILKKAIQYIEENYTDDELSLNEVASIINVSPNYFSAVFSTEMDKTFVEYVTDKRMEKAKKLLRTTEKLSGDIANEVGYKDPHYFSFVFKKTQGITPREYRNGKE